MLWQDIADSASLLAALGEIDATIAAQVQACGCSVCGSPVQRIVYSSNETNYCATCQTGGKLLADRALSRLLKKDWPRTIEELEDKRSDTSG